MKHRFLVIDSYGETRKRRRMRQNLPYMAIARRAHTPVTYDREIDVSAMITAK